jgi:hypothetical protein
MSCSQQPNALKKHVKKKNKKSSSYSDVIESEYYTCGYRQQQIKKKLSISVMTANDINNLTDTENESMISVSPFDIDSSEIIDSDDNSEHHISKKSSNHTNILADLGCISLVMSKKKSNTSTPSSSNTPSPSSSNDKYDDFDDFDEFDDNPKQRYIQHMNNLIEKLKKLKWGQLVSLSPDPDFDLIFSTVQQFASKHCCKVTKIVRYDSYVFMGSGAKQILKYFMRATKDNQLYGFTKIVQILDFNNRRQFIPIRNWSNFWDMYADELISNRHMFEMIMSHQPCKPYLDIEWIESKKNPKTMSHAKFINMLCKDIIKIFEERYDHKIYKSSIMISNAHSDKKVSFHIVIDHKIKKKTLVFETNRKGIKNSAWDLYFALISLNTDYQNVLDGSVYTTDREFRAIYSNKNSDFRPFLPYRSKTIVDLKSQIPLEKNKCMRYLVTSVDDGFELFIKTPSVPKEFARFVTQYDSDIYIPHVYSDSKIRELIDFAKTIHPTAEYTGVMANGGWRFTYRDRSEPCYTGNYHDSNGFYLAEHNNIIRMHCLSDQCNVSKILNKKEFKKSTKRMFS